MALNEKFFNSATVAAEPFFNTVTYPGDSAATNDITGVGFQPDLVWIKNRTKQGANWITDSVRGASKGIMAQSTSAEITSLPELMSSFNLDGFRVGYSANDTTNISTSAYVAWCWKAGGAPVSNGNGSITSQVSANADAGFSIVKYSGGNSSGTTVGHGLSSAPELIITKNISASTSWPVFITGGIPMNSATFNTGFEPYWVMIKRTDSSGSWFMYDNVRGEDKYLFADSDGGEGPLDNIDFTGTGFNLKQNNASLNVTGGTYIYYAIA